MFSCELVRWPVWNFRLLTEFHSPPACPRPLVGTLRPPYGSMTHLNIIATKHYAALLPASQLKSSTSSTSPRGNEAMQTKALLIRWSFCSTWSASLRAASTASSRSPARRSHCRMRGAPGRAGGRGPGGGGGRRGEGFGWQGGVLSCFLQESGLIASVKRVLIGR